MRWTLPSRESKRGGAHRPSTRQWSHEHSHAPDASLLIAINKTRDRFDAPESRDGQTNLYK